MNYADLIREARQRAGLSQMELARRLGTTQSAISRLERGRTNPSVRTLERIAAACGATLRLSLVPARGAEAEFESTLALSPALRLRQLARAAAFQRAGRRAMDASRG